jgi:hypothetical protein
MASFVPCARTFESLDPEDNPWFAMRLTPVYPKIPRNDEAYPFGRRLAPAPITAVVYRTSRSSFDFLDSLASF